jgi:hypothetical protein
VGETVEPLNESVNTPKVLESVRREQMQLRL